MSSDTSALRTSAGSGDGKEAVVDDSSFVSQVLTVQGGSSCDACSIRCHMPCLDGTAYAVCVWNNRCMWAGHKRLTQRVAVAVSRHASQVKRQIVVFPGDAQTFSEHMQRCAACLGVGSCSVLMRQGVSPQRPVLPIQGLQPREYGAAACSSPRGCHCVCDCVRTPRLSARRPVLACSPASLAGRHACTKACTAAFPILRMWARLAWRLLFPRPAA